MEPLTNSTPRFGPPTNVSVEKLEELDKVLTSLLASSIARETYSQIIEGIPICTPLSDDFQARKNRMMRETSTVKENPKPSDRAIRLYEEVRTTFDLKKLVLDSTVAQNYQNASAGSREHLLRLLEIAAAALHSLAGMLYRNYHRDTEIRPREPPEGHDDQFSGTDNFYVNFYHTCYKALNHYPFGLLNVVGYWAEAEILGGVVLFERGESGSKIINAFLHPQTTGVAFQLSDHQIHQFANLGTGHNTVKTANVENLLPFTEEVDARTEYTFVMLEEAPLRIYKNEYDKPPVVPIPRGSPCMIKQDSKEGKKAEETMRIIKEKGWLKERQA